jgi:hypothetical protein
MVRSVSEPTAQNTGKGNEVEVPARILVVRGPLRRVLKNVEAGGG